MADSESCKTMAPIPTAASRVRSSSDGEQESERPERMRDWLMRMINSGRFPGLEWLDPEKTIFKVPWIHAKKRGYNRERDAALFREWAVHSGKYRDESDPTVWKINFRCAINGLKDIMELKDLQTEDCRVYKVLPSTRKAKRRRNRLRSSTEPYTYPPTTAAAASSLYGSPHNVPSLAWPPYQTTAAAMAAEPYPSATTASCHYQPNMRISPMPYHSVPSTYSNHSITEAGNYYSPHSYSYSESCVPTVSCPVSTQLSSLAIRREDSPDSGIDNTHSVAGSPPAQASPQPFSTAALPTSSCCRSDVVYSVPACTPSIMTSSGPASATSDQEIVDVIVQLAEDTHHPTSPPLSPPPYQLKVTVFYGSVPVLSKDISCHRGCRIFSGLGYQAMESHPHQSQNFESLFGPPDAEQISLPPMHQVPAAKNIFSTMSRGLLLEMHNNDIYATPLCHNVVFCGQSFYADSAQLEREKRTKVFDYSKHFQPALEQYSLSRGLKPEPCVIFSLGQSWGPHRPVNHNLIYIVVSHMQAAHDLKMFEPPFPLSHDLFSTVHDSVDVQQASPTDIRAEAFLTSVFPLRT